MDENKCCNNPHYVKSYTPCYPFRTKLCLNCGELISDMNPVVEWIFEHFLAGIWFGVSKIDEQTLTNDDKKLIEENFNS